MGIFGIVFILIPNPTNMKIWPLVIFILLFVSNLQGQKKNQLDLLDNFIVAHNLGTDKAISTFINNTYSPSLLRNIDLKKHVAFYDHIIKEFGPLNDEIYEVVEVQSNKLIVQLIKENENIKNKSISPTEILMVEIDTDEDQPQYLSRGLGLGAMACSVRKEE